MRLGGLSYLRASTRTVCCLLIYAPGLIIRFPYAAPFEFCLTRVPMSPCPHDPSRVSREFTFAQELRSDLHFCTIRKRYASTSWPLRTWMSTHLTFSGLNPHNFATATLYKSIWP